MKRRSFISTVAASSAAAALHESPLNAMQSPPSKATKITLLGTRTPAPSLERAGSGYFIEVGDDRIVMHHGPDAGEDLMELTFKGPTIANIEGY